MFRALRSLLRVLAKRQDFEANMTEELRCHIDQYTEDLIRSGIDPIEAARRARLEFGTVNTVREDCRQARGLFVIDECVREIRHVCRGLLKSPGFTVTAITTLALCFGANIAIFAVIDSILLRPLPFPEPDRIVTIYNTYPKAGVERDGASLTNYFERRGHIAAFSSIAVYRLGDAIVSGAGTNKREEVSQISADFLPTLNINVMLGRNFSEEQTQFKNDSVALITEQYWRSRYQSNPNVIGQTIRVDSFAKIIIGVLPKEFRFLSSEAQVYLPLSSSPQQHAASERHSGGNFTQMIARLNPGVTIAQAQAQIDAQNTALEMDNPQAKFMADAGFRSLVVSLHADHVSSIRPTILMLQTGVLLLLLIGSFNLANLLLVRAGARKKELAVRRALGAGRAHIMLTSVLEVCVLTLAGSLCGLAIGAAGIRLFATLGAAHLPLGSQIALSGRVCLLAVAAALVLGVVLAIPMAWFYLRDDLNLALKSETRTGTTGRAAQKLRHSLIISEIALSFVLLAGAGMLGLSLKNASAISPGFAAQRVISAQVSLIGNNYRTPESGLAFIQLLMHDLQREPGVVSAGIVNNVPFSGHSGKSSAHVKGYVLPPGASPHGIYSYGVGGDYFEAMGFILREGRFLTDADSRSPVRPCIVDDDFAHYYWPHQSAVGQHLWQGSGKQPDKEAFTVVGVVKSARQAGVTDQGQGAVYYPFLYRPDSHIFVVARAVGSPESLGLALQKLVRRIDPELAVEDIRSMDNRIGESLLLRRSPAMLAALFSALALLLTAIGIYGVLSYTVSQRRREIGVRMALGAQPSQILTQFFLLALRLLLAGTAIGIIGVAAMGRAMQSILFQVTGFDPLPLCASVILVTLVSLAACVWPARRAALISPTEALAEQ